MKLDGIPIAGIGHLVLCPQCKGNFPIAEGAATHYFGKLGTALDGMKTACGASLIASQQRMKVNCDLSGPSDVVHRFAVLDYIEGNLNGSSDGIFDPFSMDGPMIAEVGGAATKAVIQKGMSRSTYVFGTDGDNQIRGLLSRVNLKHPKDNSPNVLKELQSDLGFTEKSVTSFLDTPTYRAIRDWKADYENRKTVAMADALLDSAIRPALKIIKNSDPAMENLLLGTAIQESGFFTHRAQTTGGPGTGLFQIEPISAGDILKGLAKKSPEVFGAIVALGYGDNITQSINKMDAKSQASFAAAVKASLQDSDAFGAAIAGQLYTDRIARNNLTVPQPSDVNGLAELWKRLYNTSSGRGTVAEYISKWNSVFGEQK
ncbi:PAAR domain-containing protein [Massilia sp. TS11]|nr:PAAR domain-containing protein [Massilia sp. TS11]